MPIIHSQSTGVRLDAIRAPMPLETKSVRPPATASIAREDEEEPLEGFPRGVLGASTASLALLVFAWCKRFGGTLDQDVKDTLETVYGIDFVLAAVAAIGGVGLLLYFRYGPLPSRDGARLSAWGASLAVLSLALLLATNLWFRT